MQKTIRIMQKTIKTMEQYRIIEKYRPTPNPLDFAKKTKTPTKKG